MAKTFLCLAMVAAGFPGWAGALTLKVEPASLSALPGTPMPVELVVTNTSGGDLLLVGETLERAFQVKEALLCRPDGRAVLCESGSSEIILRSNAPPSTWPKVVFPAGGVRVIQQQISSQNTCPLDSVPPGDYVGRLAVEVVLWEGGQARPMVEAVQVSIKVLQPEGVDATALEALRQFLKNADPKALRGCTEQVKPLGWQEVLLSTRVPSTKILLENFPTSTYAGYVLVKLGGGMSLEEASRVTPEVRDQVWYVPTGANLEKQEDHRKTTRKKYEEFVATAQTFLGAHPDFSQRALLRKQLAIHLFYLDRTQEAWAEVEALSKLEGPWAEEARALMECKAVSRKD